MPKRISDTNDFSEPFKERIRLACEKDQRFRFTIYDKQFKFERSPSGSGVRTVILKPVDFNNDPILLSNEVLRLRKEQGRKNRLYKIGSEKRKSVKMHNIKMEDIIASEINDSPLNNESIIVAVEELKGLAKYGIKQLSDIDIYMPKTGASTVASMGSGQTGKSTLLRYVYDKYYSNEKWINFLYTLSANIDLFKNHDEFLIVRNGFGNNDEAMIEMMKNLNFQAENKYSFMNFFDDILQGDNKNNPFIAKLCLFYRNQNISSWFSTQYPYLISKSNRTNINSFIFFRLHNMEFLAEVIVAFLKPYFKKILGPKANMDEMVNFYHEATADHGFIYLIPFEDRITFHKLAI